MLKEQPTSKVIQISSSFDKEEGLTVTALCEDGSIWDKLVGGWQCILKAPPKRLKKIMAIASMSYFEKFLNDPAVEIIQVEMKVVEQSFQFQESFFAIVSYYDLKGAE